MVGIHGFFGCGAGRGLNAGCGAQRAICWRGDARIYEGNGHEDLFLEPICRVRAVSSLFLVGRVAV